MTARILIIAGSDSGGGAGIQADIKTVTMLGGHAMTAITAVTAQNTLGVDAIHPIPTGMVVAQIDAVVRDIGVDAVKIVFDPVMVATSGSTLADTQTIDAFERLMAIASLVTPNLPELEALGGVEAILQHGCHVLVKGGHDEGDEIVDRLMSPRGETREWCGKRIDTEETHGTGCTLASAIACGLGQRMSIDDAIGRAISFVRIALIEAPGLGAGHGPLGQQNVVDFQ